MRSSSRASIVAEILFNFGAVVGTVARCRRRLGLLLAYKGDILTDVWQFDILSLMKKRTTIYLDESDRKAIVQIKQKFGVTSDSDAIRLALRLLAEKAQEKKSD